MVHCILLTVASAMCPVMYDLMRDVYNAILPGNGPSAPQLEEWSGMSCICNLVFCRYDNETRRALTFSICLNHRRQPRNELFAEEALITARTSDQ